MSQNPEMSQENTLEQKAKPAAKTRSARNTTKTKKQEEQPTQNGKEDNAQDDHPAKTAAKRSRAGTAAKATKPKTEDAKAPSADAAPTSLQAASKGKKTSGSRNTRTSHKYNAQGSLLTPSNTDVPVHAPEQNAEQENPTQKNEDPAVAAPISESPSSPEPTAKKTAKAPAKRSSRSKKAALPKDLPASGPDKATATEASPAEQSKAVPAPQEEPDSPAAAYQQAASPQSIEQAAALKIHNESPTRTQRKADRRTPKSRPAQKQASDPVESKEGEDIGNRAPSPANPPHAEILQADIQPDWEGNAAISSILPSDGQPMDVRSIHRTPHRNRQPGWLPDVHASPYPQSPYAQDTFNALHPEARQSLYGKRKGRDRKLRHGRSSAIGYRQDETEYTAAALSESILGAAQVQKEMDLTADDDGPQPALPGQPLAMQPFSDELAEEDLEALDAAVNGNRIGVQTQQAAREGNQGRKPRKTPRELRAAARSEQKNARAEQKAAAAAEESATDGKKTRRVLYISVVPGEHTEVVITEDGQVTEYFVEMSHQVKIRGNIYKGVINNIDANLQAAFVNYGNGKNGFLQIDEVHPEYYLVPHEETPGAKYPPIQKALKTGQEVLVQVVKEPAGTKGAFLTTWISIAGRFLVLTPGQEQIGVSRKVTDQATRAKLKELIADIQPGDNMGVIIRTASEGASPESIQQDLQFLKKLYGEIMEKAGNEKSPSLIYQEADLASRAMRDYLSDSIAEIWTDDDDTYKRISETVSMLFPGKDMVRMHNDQRKSMWEQFGILKQLESVTSREVLLPSGGRLVFDQTEALMAIDINSGKTQGKNNFEAMVFRTNMEAAEAIARHLRLRDIGGQVVIDFIEMREKNHCIEVERTLRNAMRRDKASHDVGHMSSFGLLELVRQRTGTSAISISTEPCPHCHGTGLRRNMEWQSLHALRDIELKLGKLKEGGKGKKFEHHSPEHTPFAYECETELALYLLNRKRDRIIALEEKFNARIEIKTK